MGHVYHIPCAGANETPCPGTYVGETERTVGARFQEHLSTSSNALGHYKSAMLQHARQHHHHFRKEDVTILSSEHDWVKRGIREALFIQALNPSINIDPGRHALSTHFTKTLKEVIIKPPSPAPHNPETESLVNTAPRRQGRPRKAATPSSSQPAPQQQQQQQPQQPQLSQPLPQRPLRQSQRIRSQQQQQTQH